MCTKLFGWNVRGFNISNHRSSFKNWFKSNEPIFGGLIETHVKQPKHIKFINELLPGWSFVENYDFSELGKIWVMWHPTVKVDVISKSLQMITCDVLLPDTKSWIVISVVYASNDEVTRKALWQELRGSHSHQRIQGKPWLVIGDFNQVLHPNEHSKPINLNVNGSIREFRDCLLDSDLADLTYKGNTFTWWNKHQEDPVAKKLDRALVNDLWGTFFPSSFAVFGEPDFSDHASCGIVLNPSTQRQNRPFKFYNFLLQNSNFLPLVESHWYSTNVRGSAMYRVSKKLQSLKKFIREFNKGNYSNLEKCVSEAHDALLLCQNLKLANPSPQNAYLENIAQTKWQTLYTAEESFFRQRSRITWLKEGDGNTAYFHRMTKAKNVVNHIPFLIDANGARIESQTEIHSHCVNFFSDLLGSELESPMFIQEDVNLLLPFSAL